MPRKKHCCCSESAPAVPPKKCKQYSQESLSSVLEAVRKGMLVRRACVLFGVPWSTSLQDQVNGKVVHCTKAGPKLYLTPSVLDRCGRIKQVMGRQEAKSLPLHKMLLKIRV